MTNQATNTPHVSSSQSPNGEWLARCSVFATLRGHGETKELAEASISKKIAKILNMRKSKQTT
jgi:hypothetical protein